MSEDSVENAVPLSHFRQLRLRPLALGDVPNQRKAVEPTSPLEPAGADLNRKHGSILPTLETLEGDVFAGVEAIRQPPDRRLVQANVEIQGYMPINSSRE